jgi:predicted ATP-grasp superfamily ATP-dependent carboligase
MRAFVTDGNERPALAITRSLGRRGLTVLVGADTDSSLASASRYCAGHLTYPSPERQPLAFDRFLLDLVRPGHVDVVVPVTDVAMRAIAANQRVLGQHCALACPPFEAYEAMTDKWSLVQRADACGIPAPRTRLVEGLAGLREIAPRIAYPVVVKATRSRILTSAGWRGTTVHYARSRDELARIYGETEYLASHPSLIQERIAGPGLAIFGLFDRGRLLTAFAHRRLREKPPSGGVSVLSESVAVAPQLRAFAVRLLEPLGWTGVAMLEFKQDRRSGQVYLIEVNGRFWGSLQLAVDAGVDFPFLAVQLALGRSPAVPQTYRVGVRNRWLLGDLDHLLLRLRRRERDALGTEPVPSRLRAVVDFLKFAGRGLHYETISLDDRRPFSYELRQYVRTLSAAVAHRVQTRAARTSVPLSSRAH